MKWKQKEFEYAITLIKSGKTYNDVAIKLNRSIASVKSKLKKNGFFSKDYLVFTENVNCLNCNKQFESYKSDNRKFCSKSCSVSFNNSKNPKRVKKYKNECLQCNKETNNTKFCSQECNILNKWELKKKDIELGLIKENQTLRKYLIKKEGHQCKICNKTEWEGKEIPLVLDHINGDPYNNLPSNLRMICPNCDALTDTYKGKNVGNGRHERMKRYYEGKSY